MHNEQERLAREWADRIMSTTLERIDPVQRAAAEFILAHVPAPTMADVEWDDEKHYLAGAVCEVEGAREVVVMVAPRHDGQILCLNAEVSGAWLTPLPSDLTPNGKRYELVEDAPADPIERPYWVETDDGAGWELVDEDGMCREDYMEWKPWKWYGDEGPMPLEDAVKAVRMGAAYKRPYRIMRGDDVVLEIPAQPEKNDGGDEA